MIHFPTSSPASAAVLGVYEEPTIWETVERMSVGQLAGMLILFGLFAVLLTVALMRCRAIVGAAKQTRAYETRVLTALFYDRIDEAIRVSTLFSASPVAAVVSASLQGSRSAPNSLAGTIKPSKPAFQRAVVAQSIALKRWLWVLAAIGWSSPAIGLATALVPSTHYYGGGPPLPFCLGLLIAVPALWMHKGLAGEVELLLIETDRMSLSIIDQIADQTAAQIDKHGSHGA